VRSASTDAFHFAMLVSVALLAAGAVINAVGIRSAPRSAESAREATDTGEPGEAGESGEAGEAGDASAGDEAGRRRAPESEISRS
jgi:hypothetical protein